MTRLHDPILAISIDSHAAISELGDAGALWRAHHRGMLAPRRVWTLGVCLLLAMPACLADTPGDLARYLTAPDPSYGWREVRSGRLGKTEITELILTSQTWRGIPWKHQLVVLRPSTLAESPDQALLFIHGGRWKPEYEMGQTQLPREARIFANLAETLRAPVAVLRHVPHQPLFDRREDALIAYTFDHYLETGEPDWPLLLPMVKSAVRAMDTVQTFARERWQLPLAAFTVAGASKRGWTSWLTAAVDPRVASVAPIAIDMLNVPAQIELQRATFGALSEQIRDYVAIDLPGRVNTERGRSLLAMVDPYAYRGALDQPKLILLGTNDAYWPLDALKVYWDELPEPKRVLYVPNQGHGMRDLDRLVGGLAALHRYSAHGERLPVVSWTYALQPDRFEIDVQSNRVPRRVIAWTAHSASRDFRAARWSSHRCRREGQTYACNVPRSREGYSAAYAELWFKDAGYPRFPLATVVCIAGTDGEPPDC
jgi:PhoPQ-activated pathogenicity-related protein